MSLPICRLSALIVTAEPYYAVVRPSNKVVAENILRQETKGFEEPIDAKFDVLEGNQYTIDVPADQLPRRRPAPTFRLICSKRAMPSPSQRPPGPSSTLLTALPKPKTCCSAPKTICNEARPHSDRHCGSRCNSNGGRRSSADPAAHRAGTPGCRTSRPRGRSSQSRGRRGSCTPKRTTGPGPSDEDAEACEAEAAQAAAPTASRSSSRATEAQASRCSKPRAQKPLNSNLAEQQAAASDQARQQAGATKRRNAG